MDIRYDCWHFKGTMPCHPHKEHGVECNMECKYYDATYGNVLIIKLGAMGDVIRTTPLLVRIKKEYPNKRIFWLTQFSAVLPNLVDQLLTFSTENLTYLRSLSFDIGINLDKEPEACALLDQLEIEKKFGFGLNQGMPAPINEYAEHKFLTGISDTYSKANTQHYLEEIFAVCNWKYAGEEYVLPEKKNIAIIDSIDHSKPIIGLNTGCGVRWTSRQWPIDHWKDLARILFDEGLNVIMLGGKSEDEQNRYIAEESGAKYLGFFPFNEFISLVDKCAVIVSTVTMAMHVAIGLKKPLVLLNNIFNPHEFHFFSESMILGPEKECECYYRPTCINEISCIADVKADMVFDAINKLQQK